MSSRQEAPPEGSSPSQSSLDPQSAATEPEKDLPGVASYISDEPSQEALKSIRKRDLWILPIPRWQRYDPTVRPEKCFPWSWKISIVFSLTATVAVMNLYYTQPMLVAIANDLHISHNEVSLLPTLSQLGYGSGIVLISPLGDLVRRRQLVLLLLLLTTTLSVGLALAPSIRVLEGLSFVVGLLTVSPQICIPWTADLAPSNIRATAMSLTISGLIVGLVLGRVLGGVIADLASWRDTYWLAVAAQGGMVFLAWLGLPDTPHKDIGLSYLGLLWSMAKFLRKYPTLTQACVAQGLLSAVFAGFWVTATFLLSDPPYHYSALVIGLFGLLGIVGALIAPPWGRLVDRIVPWTGQVMGVLMCLTGVIIALAAAERSVGAVCAMMVLYNMGQQCTQVASSYRIAGLDPKARARTNGCILLFVFIGQTTGTAVLPRIYGAAGWSATGGTCVAFVGSALLVLLMRGPHERHWVGWRGGSQLFRREQLADLSPEAITEEGSPGNFAKAGA